jgi:hypothetical protein
MHSFARHCISFHSISRASRANVADVATLNVSTPARAHVQDDLCQPLSSSGQSNRHRHSLHHAAAATRRHQLRAPKAENDAMHAVLTQFTQTMAAQGGSAQHAPRRVVCQFVCALSLSVYTSSCNCCSSQWESTRYALSTLDDMGICIVPGSGFGQKVYKGHLKYGSISNSYTCSTIHTPGLEMNLSRNRANLFAKYQTQDSDSESDVQVEGADRHRHL